MKLRLTDCLSWVGCMVRLIVNLLESGLLCYMIVFKNETLHTFRHSTLQQLLVLSVFVNKFRSYIVYLCQMIATYGEITSP